MTQLIRNYIALGGAVDLPMANDIYVLFQEYAQGVDKGKCYDRLMNLLICNS